MAGSDFDGQAVPGLQGTTPDQAANAPLPNQLVEPILGNATPPAQRPAVNLLQPPRQSNVVPIIPQSSLALPAGIGNPAGANLVPVIPFPVLGRNAKCPAWAIPVQIAGLKSVTVRATYQDLHMQAGIRGAVLSYGNCTGNMIKCNATGMAYNLPDGPATAFVPLFMMTNMIDLVISSTDGFPANASCILTTEEQVPFVSQTTEIAPNTSWQAQANNAVGAAVAAFQGTSGQKLFLDGFICSGLGATAALAVQVQVQYLAADGVTNANFLLLPAVVNVPAGATTPITPYSMTFPGGLPYPVTLPATVLPKWIVTLGAFGVGNTLESVQAWGHVE